MTPPLVVAGMHRSGTSLVASFCGCLGIDMGVDLVPADRNNPTGYFEDTRFLALNQRMLAAATRADDGGHPDWGWTESGLFDRARLGDFAAEARALVADAGRGGRLWGWKDPRTTVVLDFWAEVAGDARFVLVYRFPWDVADSMQRLAAPVFLDHPEYAFAIWSYYNRQLLGFFRRHRDRAVLVSANRFARDPQLLARLVDERLGYGVDRSRGGELVDPARLQTIAGDDPLIQVVAATSPEVVELLAELDQAADLPATGLWRVAPLAPTGVAPNAADPVELSVIMPCHDDGQFLVEAVASAMRACPPAHELIIVNDGSTQRRTLVVLAALRRAGFTVVDQPNLGLSAARNRGIELARGRYYLPLDADNRLRPGFAASAIAVLDNDPAAGVVYGDCQEFGSRNQRRAVAAHDPQAMLWRNQFDACAVIRRRVWEDNGGYDVALPAWEDWEFWINAAAHGWGFHRLPGITFDYRVRPTSLVSVAAAPEMTENIVDRVVRKHRDLYQRAFEQTIGNIAAWPLWYERERAALYADRARIQRELDACREELTRVAPGGGCRTASDGERSTRS